jgi:hypothetical protein
MENSDVEKVFGITNKQFEEHINTYIKTINCNVCGNTHGNGIFLLSIDREMKRPRILSIPSASIAEDNNIQFSTPSLQNFYYQITCSKCGQAILFSAMDVIRRITD